MPDSPGLMTSFMPEENLRSNGESYEIPMKILGRKMAILGIHRNPRTNHQFISNILDPN